MSNPRLAHFSPSRTILSSFFLTIIIGTLLLALPISRTVWVAPMDLLFSATSATCVTGLFTVPLENFTLFGQAVLLALIQIGGLGLITLTLFVLSLFVDFGLATQLMAGKILEIQSWTKIKNLLIFIIVFTLSLELLGAGIIYWAMHSQLPEGQAWFFSLFHSVSAFCNAGIPTLQQYSNNNILIATLTILMFIGGLGFITLHEIMRYIIALSKKKRFVFSLHSKIVIWGSFALLIAATIIFWMLEHNNILAHLTGMQTILHSIFYAVSCKSSGFVTTAAINFQLATFMYIIIFGFIGSAPGSTGSGIKITNLAIFIATVKSAITGKTSVNIMGRNIVKDQIYKSIAIVSISFCWIILTTFCLLITEQNWGFLDIFFEVNTAFTSLGISTGVTPTLSTIGKIFIMASMFVGRIGSLTLILALKLTKKPESSAVKYPEERVMLG